MANEWDRADVVSEQVSKPVVQPVKAKAKAAQAVEPIRTNRHPVDELFENRAAQKVLKAREEVLRDMILAGSVELVGYDCEASVRESTQERFNSKKAKELLGERARDCVGSIKVRTVIVGKRGEPEASE
jgi:hypothetical protein